MAKEYIEREALIQHMQECKDENAFTLMATGYAYSFIEAAPSADVVEVKHGEWLDNGDKDINGVSKPFAISCSVCGSSAGTSWMKYCPNCGAKMDGETK